MGLCGNRTDACYAYYAYVYGNSTYYPNYKADPDIAGIGIISTFVSSSFFTLCLAAIYSFLTASSDPEGNCIDNYLGKVLGNSQWLRVAEETRIFWASIIEEVILNLSDQQILFGLATLITGFATHCSISAYHFALVSDLAWFSSNVHLVTLGVLRNSFLRKDKTVQRNWRVCLMLCMAILLLASSIMQGHWAFYCAWTFDAQCLFDDLPGNIGGKPAYWMKINVVFIIYEYSLNVSKMFNRSLAFMSKWFYTRPIEQLKQHAEDIEDKKGQLDGHALVNTFLSRLIYSIALLILKPGRVTIVAIGEVLDSQCIDFALNCFWFAYGLWGIVLDRKSVSSQMDGDENALTFGQIVPLLLLGSVVFIFREAYDDQLVKSREKYPSERSDDAFSMHSGQRPFSKELSHSEREIFTVSDAHHHSAQDREFESPTFVNPPRRIDTEIMQGGYISSAFETSRPHRDVQRRPTFPASEKDRPSRLSADITTQL